MQRYVQLCDSNDGRPWRGRRACGERDDFEHDGRADYDALADAAWIVEVVAALRANGAAEPIIVRSEANERGLFWKGAGRLLPDGNGAGLYIDVIADLRTHRCAVAVKVADGDQAGRWACVDAALRGAAASPLRPESSSATPASPMQATGPPATCPDAKAASHASRARTRVSACSTTGAQPTHDGRVRVHAREPGYVAAQAAPCQQRTGRTSCPTPSTDAG